MRDRFFVLVEAPQHLSVIPDGAAKALQLIILAKALSLAHQAWIE